MECIFKIEIYLTKNDATAIKLLCYCEPVPRDHRCGNLLVSELTNRNGKIAKTQHNKTNYCFIINLFVICPYCRLPAALEQGWEYFPKKNCFDPYRSRSKNYGIFPDNRDWAMQSVLCRFRLCWQYSGRQALWMLQENQFVYLAAE